MIQRQQLRLSEEKFDLIVEQKLFDERIIDTIRMLKFLSTNDAYVLDASDGSTYQNQGWREG